MSAQLAYAEYLLSGAPGPCAERLERAQEQLGSVDASTKARALFPNGWARAVELEYRLHLARAACGSGAGRRDELLASVAAARRAVELYRSVFDYHSMVVMQYDMSVALHRLGKSSAALTALEAALDMDREYGFASDARENYRLLLTWQGKPAGALQVATLMQDFPKRQAVLKFGWRPSNARITLDHRRESLENGRITRSEASAAFERRIATAPDGGWSVSYAHRVSRYEPGVWPSTQGSQTPRMVFPPAALPPADFKVSGDGEFEGVTDSKAFAARLAAATKRLIKAGAPAGERGPSLTAEAVATMTGSISPGMLEAEAAENYQIETAMWIGAALEQGVWYEISAPLSLPGIPRVAVQHRIEFAFTRMVPCTADAGARKCAEIVIRATPDKEALARAIAGVGALANLPITDFSASTDARIVTDPATLLPYAREERIYWYAAVGKGGGDTVLQSEHLVSTTRYDSE